MFINLIEIFGPYLTFISFLLTLIINIYLISKNAHWFVIIFANIVLTVTMNLLGLGAYDFITQAITTIINMLIELITTLIDSIGDLFKKIIDAINPFS